MDEEDLVHAFDQGGATKKDHQIAALEGKLERERDDRKEDRFCFFLAGLILLDMMVFPSMETWGAPIAILLLEAALVLAVARRCGVDDVVRFLDKVIGGYLGRNGS